MTKLAPLPIASTMMATWFLGSSLAQMLQAQISKLTAQETIGGQVLDPKLTLETYNHFFMQVGLWGVGIGVAMAIASPLLNRLAHPKGDRDAKQGVATGMGAIPPAASEP
jgi:POT family proton-dependent oligopeptide transporter